MVMILELHTLRGTSRVAEKVSALREVSQSVNQSVSQLVKLMRK